MYFAKLLAGEWLWILAKAMVILAPMEVVWLWAPSAIRRFRVPQPKNVAPIIRREIPLCVLCVSLYMIPVALVVSSQARFGYSVMYTDINKFGYIYAALTFFIFVVFIDAWLFWQHWLMHHLRVFRRVHAVHHRSYTPTPVSAFSFHFVEGFCNTIPFAILLMTIPWHPLPIAVFGLFGNFFNAYIHSGYDFGLSWKYQHPILRWFYSSLHHSIHHQKYDGNFGTYFTYWDKIMGTEILE